MKKTKNRYSEVADTKPWIGVDLDGCIAEYHGWTTSATDIGKPVPLMVERVKTWLEEGVLVKIFTARIDIKDPELLNQVVCAIQFWCKKHIGAILPITATKDYAMIQLWDDRCVQVIPNTGVIVGDHYQIYELPKPKD